MQQTPATQNVFLTLLKNSQGIEFREHTKFANQSDSTLLSVPGKVFAIVLLNKVRDWLLAQRSRVGSRLVGLVND